MRCIPPADRLLFKEVSVIYVVNKASGSFYTLLGGQQAHRCTGSLRVMEARDKEQNMEQEATTLLFLTKTVKSACIVRRDDVGTSRVQTGTQTLGIYPHLARRP